MYKALSKQVYKSMHAEEGFYPSLDVTSNENEHKRRRQLIAGSVDRDAGTIDPCHLKYNRKQLRVDVPPAKKFVG